ncbi:hypothetical protein SAMN05443634_103132 [Chishuiella changwenlii]|uniref:CarboxypepD_reg-like domain-containing protein n=2 Tax=Chishuiella changwenlii TaxID=1434701 RepID=A0A1M6V073_9FLAO|nr:hypothetical protein [Chishuiella changwenlii]SHK74755.1 hypothetical protein SAMN05443634_103132 [Chishuiella changwenlii]
MQLKIDEKCQQNWEEMGLISNQEKFCELCAKSVHDLDNYSFKELKTFMKSNSSACVKIERRNLNQFNSFENSQSISHQTKKWFQLSSLLGFLSFSSITNAQGIKENDSIVLKGVINDVNDFPEADVFVNLKGSEFTVYTDENGEFELKIPKNESNYELEFGIVKENKQSFTVINSVASELIVIKSNYNMSDEAFPLIGEVAIVKHYKRKVFFRKVGRTIAWPFKQVASVF